MWYMYVLRCADDSLYTGITTDPARRLLEHQAGRGARYTRTHLPVTLTALWVYPDRSAAARAEARFKRLSRAAKLICLASREPYADGPREEIALKGTS